MKTLGCIIAIIGAAWFSILGVLLLVGAGMIEDFAGDFMDDSFTVAGIVIIVMGLIQVVLSTKGFKSSSLIIPILIIAGCVVHFIALGLYKEGDMEYGLKVIIIPLILCIGGAVLIMLGRNNPKATQ